MVVVLGRQYIQSMTDDQYDSSVWWNVKKGKSNSDWTYFIWQKIACKSLKKVRGWVTWEKSSSLTEKVSTKAFALRASMDVAHATVPRSVKGTAVDEIRRIAKAMMKTSEQRVLLLEQRHVLIVHSTRCLVIWSRCRNQLEDSNRPR